MNNYKYKCNTNVFLSVYTLFLNYVFILSVYALIDASKSLLSLSK